MQHREFNSKRRSISLTHIDDSIQNPFIEQRQAQILFRGCKYHRHIRRIDTRCPGSRDNRENKEILKFASSSGGDRRFEICDFCIGHIFDYDYREKFKKMIN